MRPKKHKTTGSNDLFRARVDEIINLIPILHQSELMMYGKDVMERTSPGLRSM